LQLERQLLKCKFSDGHESWILIHVKTWQEKSEEEWTNQDILASCETFKRSGRLGNQGTMQILVLLHQNEHLLLVRTYSEESQTRSQACSTDSPKDLARS
jgi:hypothetical protein